MIKRFVHSLLAAGAIGGSASADILITATPNVIPEGPGAYRYSYSIFLFDGVLDGALNAPELPPPFTPPISLPGGMFIMFDILGLDPTSGVVSPDNPAWTWTAGIAADDGTTLFNARGATLLDNPLELDLGFAYTGAALSRDFLSPPLYLGEAQFVSSIPTAGVPPELMDGIGANFYSRYTDVELRARNENSETIAVPIVPEASAVLPLAGVGLAVLGGAAYRRQRKNRAD